MGQNIGLLGQALNAARALKRDVMICHA